MIHQTGGNIPVVSMPDLVDDVLSAVRVLAPRGCRVLVEPFDIAIGMCAVIEDPFGTRLCILDMTKGPRGPITGETQT